MYASKLELMPAIEWQYIGSIPSSEAEEIFDDPYSKEGFKELGQGCEEVSAGDWLVSSRFAQCSARILINQVDGSILMKHVGPKSTEVVFGGDTGIRPQDEYVDFYEHARKTGSTLFAVNVFGEISTHRLWGDDGPSFDDVEVVELPEICVESGGKHTWAIAYSPSTSEAIIKMYNSQEEVVYEKYQLPKAGSEADADSRERLIQQIERRRLLKRSIEHLGRIPLSSVDFQRIDETREAILSSGAMLLELDRQQWEIVEREWTRSFVRKAEISENSDELLPSMQALDILIEGSSVLNPSESSKHRSVHQLSHLVFTTIGDLERSGPGTLAMGGPILISYLDSEIESLSELATSDLSNRIMRSILELRNMSASIIETAIS